MASRPKETLRSGWRRRLGAAALAVACTVAPGLSACNATGPAEAPPDARSRPAAGGDSRLPNASPAPAAPAPRVLRRGESAVAAQAAELRRAPVAELEAFLADADPEARRIAVRALGRLGGDDAAQAAASLLRDADASVREEACFAVGLTGSPLAAALLGPILESKPTRAEVAAAAAGLAHCGDDAAGNVVLRLCLRDDLPAEGPEAIFRHVRWRGRPWPGALPDTGLLRYEKHPTARGRAGIGWMGRVWKDPALLPAFERLAKDPDPEVRRAVAMGLADGKGPTARAAADADRAMAVVGTLAKDADWRVAASACRAAASYERDDAVALLRHALGHTSFHVVTAACEGLGARKAAAAFDGLRVLSTGTSESVVRGPEPSAWPSASVRYAAAAACLAIDPKRAQDLVPPLLADASAYVRCAGAEILAASDDPATAVRLASLATTDPSVRVREAALDGLKGKDAPEARALVERTLAGDDPVLASIAADVIATNTWTEFAPHLRRALAHFPGAKGADAREGIYTALGKLGLADDTALLTSACDDPDAGPRAAAQAAFAERAGAPAPKPDRRPPAAGAAIPFGAPLLDRDVDLVVETDQGTMRIRLDASEAPIHAAHLADLARRGFYDGLTWHRVVPDFVIQGGCPRGDGSGHAGATLPLERTRTPFERGTLGMPRSNHPDTGGCQLFVCHSRAPHLDVEYAAIGRVIEGLDVIDRIDVGSKIVRVRVAEPR